MNADTAISIEHLSKKYRIGGSQRYQTIRDTLSDAASRIVQPLLNRKSEEREKPSEFWALKDVNLDINHGEIVGVIGRNGAGKTTLLKILSRITKPTEGQAIINGRVGALLEVGTAFHPELTGRENIYLNGSVLGMKKKEIDHKLESIIDFSGVERFIDTPVKRFSSGMQLRLGFAVAAHLEPEILLVDEVLAVGDIAFQRKCIGKMEEAAKGGRTVLFVSHNMEAITRLCNRVIVMEDGNVSADGNASNIVTDYMKDAAGVKISTPQRQANNCPIFLTSLQILNSDNTPTNMVDMRQPFSILIEYTVQSILEDTSIAFILSDLSGNQIIASDDTDLHPHKLIGRALGTYQTVINIPGKLLNVGRYELTAFAGIPRQDTEFDSFRNIFLNIDDPTKTSPVLNNGPLRRSKLALELPWITKRLG